jgi:hypothetical protein
MTGPGKNITHGAKIFQKIARISGRRDYYINTGRNIFLGETLGEHARRETRSRFLRHRFRAVPIFLSAFPVLAAQSVPGAILFFVCEKIFFRGLFI